MDVTSARDRVRPSKKKKRKAQRVKRQQFNSGLGQTGKHRPIVNQHSVDNQSKSFSVRKFCRPKKSNLGFWTCVGLLYSTRKTIFVRIDNEYGISNSCLFLLQVLLVPFGHLFMKYRHVALESLTFGAKGLLNYPTSEECRTTGAPGEARDLEIVRFDT